MYHVGPITLMGEDVRELERTLPPGLILRDRLSDFLRFYYTVEIFDRDWQLHLMRIRCAGHVRRQQRHRRGRGHK